MNKIKFIHLLNEQAGLSLQESKEIKDRIVNGEVVEIEIEDSLVNRVVAESQKLGVFAEKLL